MRKRTIRASEIGTYLYCKRAWWYQSQGIESSNQQEMSSGTAYHHAHGKIVLKGILLRLFAWLVLAAALVLLAVWLTQKLLS